MVMISFKTISLLTLALNCNVALRLKFCSFIKKASLLFGKELEAAQDVFLLLINRVLPC